MAIVQALSQKGNIKKSTTNDIPYSPQFPVLGYTSGVTTTAQTTYALGFSVDTTISGSLIFVLAGKILTPGSTNDYQFAGTNSSGLASSITLNSGFATVTAGINWQAFRLGVKKEAEFGMDSRFVQLYAAQTSGFQGFIDTQTLRTATATTGTPASGTFYSTISNRAAIVDITQDLRTSFGVERIQTQQIVQLQTEFGPNGESVFSVANDDRGLIRFIGNWSTLTDTSGSRAVSSAVAGDSVEVTFYGTGLNQLALIDASLRTVSYTVDGGTLTVATYPTTGSSVLNARNYATNQVFPIVSGLTLGTHTVRIVTTGTVATNAYGFEVLNTNSTSLVNFNPGTAYAAGQKISASSTQTLAYNAAVTGVRGGRVVNYVTSAGVAGQVFQAVNSASASLSLADHTNEEVARAYHWREFGAGRSDDFSLYSSTSSANLAFTLDDGTTTLVGNTVSVTTADGLYLYNTGTYITLTFVGTGLDIVYTIAAAATHTTEAFIDGASVGTFSGVATPKTQKIVSGLPYGTHTAKIVRNAAVTDAPHISKFIVYQPKKPSIPTGAIELSDYNVAATYVTNTSAALNFVPTGAIRKFITTREAAYSGSWTLTGPSDPNFESMTYLMTGTSGSYMTYSFYGAGFEYGTLLQNTGAQNLTISVDGSSNLSGYTTSLLQISTGVTFTASTGTLSGTSAAQGRGRICVSGLPVGLHTVKILMNSAQAAFMDTLDIITPIYSAKSNTNYDQQNTLLVGSNSLSDNRKTSPLKDTNSQTKNWAQAVAVVGSPTTTSTSSVPLTDMSCAVKTGNGQIRISYQVSSYNSTTNGVTYIDIYVNGNKMTNFTTITWTPSGNAAGAAQSAVAMVPVSAGTHKVDLYWNVNMGTATAASRSLLVEEK